MAGPPFGPVDEDHRLAIGRAEVIHDLAMSFKVLDARLEPFVDGSRTAIVRIEPTFLSGRRIVHDPPPAATCA